MRKKTPRETHGFTTSFSALHPTHNDTAPRVNFCGENLAEMLYRLKLLFSLPLLLRNVGDVLGLIVGVDAYIDPPSTDTLPYVDGRILSAPTTVDCGLP